MINLNELRDTIYQDACAKGLWQGENCHRAARKIEDEAQELVGEAMKIEYNAFLQRDHKGETITDDYALELSDVIIMSLSVAGYLGIDIDTAVRRKIEINRNRPYQHKGERKDGNHG